jgi:hypothetical protein
MAGDRVTIHGERQSKLKALFNKGARNPSPGRCTLGVYGGRRAAGRRRTRRKCSAAAGPTACCVESAWTWTQTKGPLHVRAPGNAGTGKKEEEIVWTDGLHAHGARGTCSDGRPAGCTS